MKNILDNGFRPTNLCYTEWTKTSVTKKYGKYRILIQTLFVNKCVCYFTSLRCYTCFVVTTILNKETIRKKQKQTITLGNFWVTKRASNWRPLLVNKAGNAEALTAAPVLIDKVWYGWCYSNQQSVEDQLHGLHVWHTSRGLGSGDLAGHGTGLDDPSICYQMFPLAVD